MTAITGTLRDSGNQLLTGELWVTLDAPLRDPETDPDSTLLPVTSIFPISNGALSIVLPESATRNITYYFQFFPTVGGEISPIATMDFHAQVPPSATAIEFADLIPTGISTDTQDTGALRIAQLLATVPEYVQALQGGPRYLGDYDAGTLYRKGDAAKYGGSWWMWIAATPGSGIEPSAVPPGSDYWLDVGSKGDPGGTGGQDTAYGPGWNGATWAPTANVIYDKIETLLPIATASSTYAPLNNAALTGNPSRVTAPAFGNRSGQIATTQWVGNEFAVLASPTFTGNPAAPTQATTDSSNKLATTKFVFDFFTQNNFGAIFIGSSSGVDINLSAGSQTTIAFPSEVDPNNRYSTTTGIFTVPESGRYRASFAAYVVAGNTINEIQFGLWNLSTTQIGAMLYYDKAVGATDTAVSGHADVFLQTGTNYGLRAFINSGATSPRIAGDIGGSNIVNSFTLQRLNL